MEDVGLYFKIWDCCSDSSEGEASESEESSGAEPSGETEDASEMETMGGSGTTTGREERAVFLKKRSQYTI